MNRPRRIVIYDLLFYIVAILLVIISVIFSQHLKHVGKDADETDYAYNLSLQLNRLSHGLEYARAAHRGLLASNDSSFSATFSEAQQQVSSSLAILDSLTRNDSSKNRNVKGLHSLLTSRYDSAAQDFIPVPMQKADGIDSTISEMLCEENKVLSRSTNENENLLSDQRFPLLTGLLALVLISATYLRVRKEIRLRHDAQRAAAEVINNQRLERETQNRLLHLADAVPVLAWLCDSEGSFYFFNKQWLAFTNRPAEEEKGQGWLSTVHADDVQCFLKGFKEAFSKRKKFLIELRLKNRYQKYRWLAIRAVPMFDADGKFIGYAGGGMDIEKQKNFTRELEEKVRERTLDLKDLNDKLQLRNTVFAHAEETASIGSYSWHLETGRLEYSDNFFKLLGYEPQEFTPTFETFLGMIHPEDQEQVKANGEKTAMSRTLFEDVYRIYTKQGVVRYFRSSGNFVGTKKELLVGTVQDVTKDMLLKETLTNQNLELERNNVELSSFTYIASHDLQEPLRKIQSFSRLIGETEIDNLSDKGKKYFERMDGAAGRMQKLIESLLNYSRINHTTIDFVKTDLNVLLGEVKTDLGELIEERKVTIQSDLLPTLNVMALQFYQLFSNIIINAIKYSKENVPPEIRITAQKIKAQEVPGDTRLTMGKFWKIAFADNGIGFDSEYAEKVFELFQRLHGRTEYEGTGIGLAICRKIVNNHNGFITASGKLGFGAVFTLYLPEPPDPALV